MMMKKIRTWDLILTVITCLVITVVACLYNGASKSYMEDQIKERGSFTGIMLNLDEKEFDKARKSIFLPKKIAFRSTELGSADIAESSFRLVVADYNAELMENIGRGALRSGRAPENSSEAVLSMSLLADLKKNVGDEVDLTYQGKEYHLKIVGELKGVYNLWNAPNGEQLYFPNVLVHKDLGIEYKRGNVMYWVMKIRTTDVTLAGSVRTDPDNGSYVITNPIYSINGGNYNVMEFFWSAGGRILTAVFLISWYYQYFRKKRVMKLHIWTSDDDEGYAEIRKNILKDDILYVGISATVAIIVGIVLNLLFFNRLTGTVVGVNDYLFEIVVFGLVCMAFTVASSLLLARQWDYQRYVYDRQAYKKKSIFDFIRKYWIEILLTGGIVYLNVANLMKVFRAVSEIDRYYDMTVLAGGPVTAVVVNIIAAAYTLFMTILLFIEIAGHYRDINSKEKKMSKKK